MLDWFFSLSLIYIGITMVNIYEKNDVNPNWESERTSFPIRKFLIQLRKNTRYLKV
jgi:hypothetical protein